MSYHQQQNTPPARPHQDFLDAFTKLADEVLARHPEAANTPEFVLLLRTATQWAANCAQHYPDIDQNPLYDRFTRPTHAWPLLVPKPMPWPTNSSTIPNGHRV